MHICYHIHMKVVIDTSVWISALLTENSHSREIIRLALQKKLIPQMGETLFFEYESVMKRTKIQKGSPLSKREQSDLFDALLSVSRWNEVYYLWRPNLTDENDNFIIELAVASGAEYVITYNLKDFEHAELSFNCKIITPKNFIKETT